MRGFWGVLALCLTSGAAMADEPVRVMILATTHFSNPGADSVNMEVDDVLTPKRQAEMEAVNAALAGFAPTMVAVEWPAELVAERYPQYVAGTLAPDRNEVVQLGFRLAKTANLAEVQAIDAPGEFLYEAVQAYADAHGSRAQLDAQIADIMAMSAESEAVLKSGSIAAALREMNRPERAHRDNSFYRGALLFGDGDTQPGVAMLAAWQERNLKICAKLVQRAKPGDRVVVLFGSGHAFLLRQCVAEMPGYELIEANDYLPQE